MTPRTLSYARVSTRDQADGGYSLDSQRERAADYARFKGWPVPLHFTDGAVSGKRDSRPGLDALLAAVRQGDVVLTKDVTRLGRGGAVQTLGLIGEIERRGASVTFIDQNIDSATPTGRMILTMMAGFSELELEQTRERSLRGRVQAARAGHWPARSVPYGYRRSADRKLELDPLTAPSARRALEALAGRSMAQAKALLEAEGVPATPKGKGKWKIDQLHYMLHTPAYVGRAQIVMDGVTYEVPCPPLISEALWAKIHQRESSEGGVVKPDLYPLTGHIRCEHGAPYNGNMFVPRKSERGPVRVYLVSTHAKRHYGCRCSNQRADALEGQVRGLIADMLRNPNDPAAFRVLNNPALPLDDPHAEEREQVRAQLSKLADLQVRGAIDLPDYLRLRGDLKAREAVLQAPVAESVVLPAQLELAEAVMDATRVELAGLLDGLGVHLAFLPSGDLEIVRMKRLVA